ncbi:DUF4254 domain-containing protein [Streptomyces sp. NPDC021224]|uniref:DUF4254 domain-containing protein n=1 Tax=unclassified Streptomyces TaxID=2593676 RepID=UPI0037AC12FE
MTAAITGGPPPLLLPPGFARAAAGLPDKELRRLDDALARLHAVNSRLWQTEDRVRTVGLSADRVADFKREIDQLNAERNVLAERADEVLGVLTGAAPAETPLHTETLASVLDRLSVLTLRIWHSEQATDRDDLAKRRVPALHRQREDLHAALDSLTADVIAGARRLPAPARYKLYGADDVASSEVTPSPRLAQVIAFGGLSECGKSTSAEFVRRVCGAQRFKIGYLLRQSAARHGLADPYALSPRRQAELLLDELNRFADAHVDIRLVTIESVHDEASIAELKKLMGVRLQTVYLDAPFAVRVGRSGMAAHAVAAKDEVKMSRGAHQVAALADHLIDNSGSIVELRARLRKIVTPPVPARPRTRSPYGLGLPEPVAAATSDLVDSLRSHAPAVQLVALTGSPGQGTWMAGWSDLDLLVVADHTGAAPVAEALRAYQRDLDGAATVGLTLATPHELFAGRLTPRVAFVLHQLQSDGPVLYADPQLELPHITTDALALAAVHELPQVMLTLRRLRATATPDLLRPLYRHLVLASRLLLREHGVWEAGPDQILAAATRLPGLPVVPVPTLVETVSAWREGTRGQALARTLPAIDALLEWYAAQLAA